MKGHTKRGHAINGDLITISHPDFDLTAPFSSHIDIVYDGITHQILSTADIGAFSFANATGSFSIGELSGYIIESLDNVATEASHVYRAVIESEQGVLATQSYQSVEQVLDLIGAVGPTPTRLGMVIEPADTVTITSAAKVAMQTDIGLIEVTPLTAEVVDQLPRWSGSSVDAGELYAGQFTDDVPYLTLVTSTCRVLAMLGETVDVDQAVDGVGRLTAHWAT